MIKLLIAFLISVNVMFGVCTSSVNGNWSSGATWTGCAGAGGVPATTDSVTIANTVTINTSFTVVAITVVDGELITDGMAHTVTITTSGNYGITLAPDTGPLVQWDSRAGSVGNEITVNCSNVVIGCFFSNEYQYLTSYFSRMIINIPSTVVAIIAADQAAVAIYEFDHIKVNGGGYTGYTSPVNSIALFYINTVSITDVTDAGGIGSTILFQGGHVPVSCSISNITSIDPIGNTQLVFGASGDLSNCTFTGLSINADVAGSYTAGGWTPGFTANNQTSGPISAQYIAANQYITPGVSTITTAAQGGVGTGTYPVYISHVSSDSLVNTVDFGGSTYTYFSKDVGFTRNCGGGNCQGLYFSNGDGGHNTSNNDISISSSIQSNTGFYDVASTMNSGWTINNGTAVSNVAQSVDWAFGLGEAGGVSLIAPPSWAFYNLAVGGWYAGMYCPKGSSGTISNTGTGGVGVANNDVYGNTGPAYYNYSSTVCTNFDNGVTQHPSSIYGDVSINPFMYETTRSYPRIDELIGNLVPGTGTAEHLFTMLSNQWNGTNGAYNPQLVWQLMYSPVVPQSAAVGNASIYYGAQPPRLLGAGAMIGQ